MRSLIPLLFQDFSQEFHNSFYPSVEVIENNDNFEVSVDIPGLNKEDIKIEQEKSLITISGERKSEKIESKGSVKVSERSYGFFKRSFSLPEIADLNSIQASYDRGVLTLKISKDKERKSLKRIEIK